MWVQCNDEWCVSHSCLLLELIALWQLSDTEQTLWAPSVLGPVCPALVSLTRLMQVEV